MAVQSAMLPLGTPLPNFTLLDVVSGRQFGSNSLHQKPALLMVICNHCPFVVHIKEELVRLGHELKQQGVSVVAISANDVSTHPTDGPEQMKSEAEHYGYPFPYLYDESQTVAQALMAMCTPDFFLFDQEGRLTYRGRLDGSTPGNDIPVEGLELRAAVRAMLDGAPPVEPQRPSIGCSIKWKAGHVPAYAQA